MREFDLLEIERYLSVFKLLNYEVEFQKLIVVRFDTGIGVSSFCRVYNEEEKRQFREDHLNLLNLITRRYCVV